MIPLNEYILDTDRILARVVKSTPPRMVDLGHLRQDIRELQLLTTPKVTTVIAAQEWSDPLKRTGKQPELVVLSYQLYYPVSPDDVGALIESYEELYKDFSDGWRRSFMFDGFPVEAISLSNLSVELFFRDLKLYVYYEGIKMEENLEYFAELTAYFQEKYLDSGEIEPALQRGMETDDSSYQENNLFHPVPIPQVKGYITGYPDLPPPKFDD